MMWILVGLRIRHARTRSDKARSDGGGRLLDNADVNFIVECSAGVMHVLLLPYPCLFESVQWRMAGGVVDVIVEGLQHATYLHTAGP